VPTTKTSSNINFETEIKIKTKELRKIHYIYQQFQTAQKKKDEVKKA
jgi:hypothetical protein